VDPTPPRRGLGARRRLAALALGAAISTSFAHAASAGTPAPWKAAAELRVSLADAEKALILSSPQEAQRDAGAAGEAAGALVENLRPLAPASVARIERTILLARRAVGAQNGVALAAARADAWTAVLAGSYRAVLKAIEQGKSAEARRWLLVREFRQPTRFSRPGADATLALESLADRRSSPARTVSAVQADLLDTYQARLRAALEEAAAAQTRGHRLRAAGLAALARGYFSILAGAYRAQRGPGATAAAQATFDRLAASALAGNAAVFRTAHAAAEAVLSGFRAAPLSAEEEKRRAGQILRFLALVPVEYGRGVDSGRVTLDFEIQEAITFRDGAAQAFGDLEAALSERDASTAKHMGTLIDALGRDLAAAAGGGRVAEPDDVKARTAKVLDLAERIFPREWQEAGATADFDVIRATIDRLEGAIAAGEFAQAEQARLEAYAFFEFGPEQRLRGLAPDLFVRVEGLFWYGADGYPGLAQLVKRKATPAELAPTRHALDEALVDAERAVGSGPTSTFAVVSNTAIIVFREGLEAVLILAALTAGLVGVRRGLRRPLYVGAAVALLATAATWTIAQTVLGSLARYGEKLEAVVSLVAIAILLLILNWFYHRVYWNEHLASLHGRKKRLLQAGFGAASAQLVGLGALGFSSVYREGFETTLFLQALVLDAGAASVLLGVLLGLAGTALVAVLTIALQRKLPHRRMLIATGLLITWVLVVMVGTTVQIIQVVGWVPVTPVEGLRLPYWAGLWFGVFPTWQGLSAQLAAVTVVIGSYFLAEHVRARRRSRRRASAHLVGQKAA
jgi:high-affinity iron transporter